MEYVKYEDAVKHANSDNCVVYEYRMQTSEMNMGFAEITNRYPENGYIVNRECSETVYIMEGSGKLITEMAEVNLSMHDVVYIPRGEKFYWEGNMTVVHSTTPAWFPEQHETIPPSDLRNETNERT